MQCEPFPKFFTCTLLARELMISTCLSFCGITRNTFCLKGEKKIGFEPGKSIERLLLMQKKLCNHKTCCLFLPIKGKILQVSRNSCSTYENQKGPHFFLKKKNRFSVLLCCFYNLFCPAFYQLYTRTTHWSTDRLFPWPCFICILFITCVLLHTCENRWKSQGELAKESCYLTWMNSWYEKVNLVYFVFFCCIWNLINFFWQSFGCWITNFTSRYFTVTVCNGRCLSGVVAVTSLNHTGLSLFLNNMGLTLTKEEETQLGCTSDLYFCSFPTEKKSTELVLCSVTSLKLMSKPGVCRTELQWSCTYTPHNIFTESCMFSNLIM